MYTKYLDCNDRMILTDIMEVKNWTVGLMDTNIIRLKPMTLLLHVENVNNITGRGLQQKIWANKSL